MKTVFILGAGASKRAGAPLMFDFLDTARKVSLSNEVANRAAFEEVFDAQSELQGVFAKSRLDIDNIEVLFGAVEMGQLIRKFGLRDADKIAQLRNSLVALIVETLEISMRFPVKNERINPAGSYGPFVEMLTRLRGETGKFGQPELAFTTFNYDLGLDHALSYYNLDFDYCLAEASAINIGRNVTQPYLKLHGSINWGYCKECKKIIPYSFRDSSPNKVFLLDVKDMVFRLGSRISEKLHCDKPLEGPPVLIPPTWNKTGYHQDLTHVWQKAAQVLGAAENIFVIGYSLPESDSFFRYLYALGSQSKQLIKRFWVFNPDQDGTVEPRFQALVGQGIANRFRFFKDTFETAIGVIENELKKD